MSKGISHIMQQPSNDTTLTYKEENITPVTDIQVAAYMFIKGINFNRYDSEHNLFLFNGKYDINQISMEYISSDFRKFEDQTRCLLTLRRNSQLHN